MPRCQSEPAWVLVDGIRHHVSDYKNMDPPDRPDATCPICKTPVLMKLGKVRSYHYAHQTNTNCPANAPETALHLNMKFHIVEELMKGMKHQLPLTIAMPCAGHCGKTTVSSWADRWDEVKVEESIDPIRPDILLLKGGNVLGVIEVYVSHLVDTRKAAQYAEKGLRWIEVEAKDELCSGDSRWQITRPLPFVCIHPAPEVWKCEKCTKIDKIRAYDARMRQEELARRTVTASQSLSPSLATISFSRHLPDGPRFGLVGDERPAGRCVLCGQITKDWWYYNSPTGTCKCNACGKQGQH